MLLNLSNHPSSSWPENQIQTAIEKYGTIKDLAFPQINPEWNTDQVRQLAEKYETKIRELNPAAVHIMGELTFTFILVNKLTAIGIHCIASTTNRTVTNEENGMKTTVFEFVRFRDFSID